MQMYRESENPCFSYILFNMEISLMRALICLKPCMCIAETCMEVSIYVSKLRFCTYFCYAL